MTNPLTETENNTYTTTLKILLVFNRLSDFKDKIYNSFLEEIDGKAKVDVYVQPISPQTASHFDQVIREKVVDYDFVAIMLHAVCLNEDILKTLNSIPKEKLLILDKRNEFIRGEYACVYQDFEQDILSVLQTAQPLVNKYKAINIVVDEPTNFSKGIANGIVQFSQENSLQYNIYTELKEDIVREKEAYLVLSEQYLVDILKVCSKRNWSVGKNIGIISYNETPLKEVLFGGITVVTTDHEQLGRSAAALILSGKKEHIRNPFVFIQRNSL
ncbi:substrate-binding domain-containing protein [Flectobacillus major]|uniref:substrate-binding domain-containing protein n=1 Tax=Flectobacillus major TaxID=103 RepID=UPI00047EE4C9|nr:substrate-binding domain-containing protein [Flectobacillus major]